MHTTHLNDCNMDFGNIDTKLFLVGSLNAFNNRFQAAGDSFLGSISWKQVFLLTCIGLFEQPPTIRELAEFIGCSHQNTKQLLLKLENGGFVVLAQDQADKRKIRISLTEKSGQLQIRNSELRGQYMTRLFEGIPELEITAAIALLQRLDKNLKEYRGACSANGGGRDKEYPAGRISTPRKKLRPS